MIEKLNIYLNNGTLLDGDIMNCNGKLYWNNISDYWSNIKDVVAYFFIRQYQEGLLGKESNYLDTHSTILFQRKLFSMEPPVCKWVELSEYDKEDVTFYRYTKKIIDVDDIAVMQLIANKIIGQSYDIPHLVEMLITEILGEPYEDDKIFSSGTSRMVCSVAVAAIFNACLKSINMPQLFCKLNSVMWSDSFLAEYYRKGGKWSTEDISPALFSNSNYFDNEFKPILRYNFGEVTLL